MIKPQYKILAGARIPTVVIKVAVAADTLNAGAAPAVPITIDLPIPSEFAASCGSLDVFIL